MQVSWGPDGFFKIDYEGELEPDNESCSSPTHILLRLFSLPPDTHGILGSHTRTHTYTHTLWVPDMKETFPI
jgi:hypothetical protein